MNDARQELSFLFSNRSNIISYIKAHKERIANMRYQMQQDNDQVTKFEKELERIDGEIDSLLSMATGGVIQDATIVEDEGDVPDFEQT